MRQDWHPADIHAALKKRGLLLDKVGPSIGLHRSVGYQALYRKRWPRVKQAIAKLLGLPPQSIWPSVFDEHGQPRVLARRKYSHTATSSRNVRRPDKAA